MITVANLIAMGFQPDKALIFADPLKRACERFGLNTPKRIGAFLGQAMVETTRRGIVFATLEEDLYYTTPQVLMRTFPTRINSLEIANRYIRNPQGLANFVYSNRFGNGNIASNDGWNYRGGGVKQLTFKDNYRAAEAALGRPYVAQPDLVRQPEDACLTGVHYFVSHGCIAMADAGNFDGITKAVNGLAMLQKENRATLSMRAIAALT